MYTNNPFLSINGNPNQKLNYVGYCTNIVRPMGPDAFNLTTTPGPEQVYLNASTQPSQGNTHTWYAQKNYPDLED